MALEIELKAWVDAPERIKTALSRLAVYCHEYTKDDTYWIFPGKSLSRLRIRREETTENGSAPSKTTVLVTCKTKEIRGGIETNDETECAVSDGNAFEEILLRLGMQPGIRKVKRGAVWKYRDTPELPPILAELSNVECLGWFIELEILSGERDEPRVEENRQRLLAFLEKLEIPPEKIEARPYAELLAN